MNKVTDSKRSKPSLKKRKDEFLNDVYFVTFGEDDKVSKLIQEKYEYYNLTDEVTS